MQIQGLRQDGAEDVAALRQNASKELPYGFEERDGKAVNTRGWGGYIGSFLTSPLTTASYAQSVLDQRYQAQSELAKIDAKNKPSCLLAPFYCVANTLIAVFHCLTLGCFKAKPEASADEAPAA